MSQSPADTTAAPGPSSKPIKPRRRITADGAAILWEYWAEHPGEMPTLSVRKALTAQIQKTPANDFYKVSNTIGWFKQRIEKHQRALSNIQTDPRFPSLTPAVLEHLTVLLGHQKNPSPDVIKTWATLLASTGATYQDLVAWVHIGIHPSQPDHLPTPAGTVTPEPSLSPNSPTQLHLPMHAHRLNLKQDPTSPVLPPISVHPQSQSKIMWHAQPSSVSPSSPISPGAAGVTQNQPPRSPTLQAIIQGVADAVASPTTHPDVVPSTAAEFNAMYAPFEKQLSQLLLVLENS